MRNKLLPLVVMLMVCPLLYPEGIGQKAAQYQNKAASLLLNGDYPAAIGQLEAAAALYKGERNWTHYFSCLNQISSAYLETGEMEAAKRISKKALWKSITELGRDNEEAAKAAHQLAEVYSRSGRLEKAMEVHAMGLQIRKKIFGAHHPSIADSYEWMGRSFAANAAYEDAERYFRKTLQMRQSLLGNNHPDVGQSYFYLGELEASKENFLQALNYHQMAMRRLTSRLGSNHPDVARSLCSMAFINYEIGEWKLAEQQFSESIHIFRQAEAGQAGQLARSLFYLADIYFQQGHFRDAYLQATQAHTLLPGTLKDGKALARENLANLAGSLFETGQYEEAAAYYERLIQQYQGPGKEYWYHQLCTAYRFAGRAEEAITSARAYQNWAEEVEHTRLQPEADAQLQLALALIGQGKGRQAGDILEPLIKTPGLTPDDRAIGLLAYGKAECLQGRYEQGIENYQRSLALTGEKSGATGLQIESLLEMGKAHAALAAQDKNNLHNLQAAFMAFQACDEILSSLSRKPQPLQLLHQIDRQQNSFYEEAIDNCYQLYQQSQYGFYLGRAFYYMERSKKMDLQSPLWLAPELLFSRAPLVLQQKINQKEGAARARHLLLQRARISGQAVDSLQREIYETEQAYCETVQSLEKEGPALYSLKYDPKVVSLEEARPFAEAEGRSCYAYFAGSRYLFILYVGDEGVQLFRQSFDAELRQSLSFFIGHVANGPSSHFDDSTRQAFSRYVENATTLRQKLFPIGLEEQPDENHPRMLGILPHGILYLFPFEALLLYPPEKEDYASLSYLGLQYQVDYQLSASAWLAPAPSSEEISNLSFTAFVPGYNNQPIAFPTGHTSSGPKGGKMLKGLHHFQELAKGWPKNNGGQVWAASRSTEYFLRRAPASETLLLAGHFLLKPEGLDSYFALSPVPGDGSYDNNLTLREWLQLNSSNRLGILASTIYSEEGASTSFAQSLNVLRYSGWQSCLAHRWENPGPPSAEITRVFLEKWNAGNSYSEALLAARKDYLQSPSTSPGMAHPHYWAGYMTMGMAMTRPPEGGLPLSGLWIVGIVVVLILIGMWARHI